jgi:hypothetical protein
VAEELGIARGERQETEWIPLLQSFIEHYGGSPRSLMRLKQWMSLASKFGGFEHFDALKRTESVEAFFEVLTACLAPAKPQRLAA